MREAAALAGGFCASFCRERVAGNDVQMKEQARNERSDQRGRRAEAGLMHVAESNTGRVEWRELR